MWKKNRAAARSLRSLPTASQVLLCGPPPLHTRCRAVETSSDKRSCLSSVSCIPPLPSCVLSPCAADSPHAHVHKQVLAEAEEAAAAPAPQAILDMRGPQARLVTDMGDLNSEAQLAALDSTPMPELQHNLRLLVDLARSDIQRLDGKLRQEQVGSPGPPSLPACHAAAPALVAVMWCSQA